MLSPSTLIRIANGLTLSRLPLGLVFWLVAASPIGALLVLFLAALTDVVDGPIARHARSQPEYQPPTKPGLFSWADPFCDKFFVLSVLLAIYFVKNPPTLLLAAVSTREIILVPLAAVYRLSSRLRRRVRYDFTAGAPGKAATVVQFGALGAILLDHRWSAGLATLAALVGVAAVVYYVARGITLVRATPAPR
jgi:phosphatidylglycerophosphate synthase